MLEQLLVFHGAPTLARLKTGNLFTAPYGDFSALERDISRLNGELKSRGVELAVLRAREGRALLYLYRAPELKQTLEKPDTQAFLARYGYGRFSPEAALSRLRERLGAFRDFPHEIGVFLGYPLADVEAFIQNEGRNYLFSGCWKVYTDPGAAQRAFARYRKCTEVYTRLFAEGRPLSRMIVQARTA